MELTERQILEAVYGISCFIMGIATRYMGVEFKDSPWNSPQIVYVVLCLILIGMVIFFQ